SFGTPTWPRYGRGLTSTHDGKAVAVCHLNEVCVYSLKGEVIQRFGNEYFSCCWGITCNNDGNYVITESKRGVVYVVDACGRVLREIGARNIEKNRKPSIKPTKQQPGQDPRTFTNQVKLSAPRYVATNYKNQIIVTDTGQKKPFVLNYDGKVCLEIGGSVAPGCQLCKGDISPSIQDHDVTEASSEYSIFDQPLDASTEHIIPQKRGRLHRCFSYVIRKLTRKSRKRRDTVQNIADFTTPIVKENTRSSYPREVLPSIQDSNDDEISFRTCEECGVVDPRGVCIDDQNNILIADKAQHRVSLFTPKGEFMRHVLTYADDVFEPRILCVINHKTLAVADGTLKIKLFNFNAV
uniref:Uncharacterized protein n=1 Tax=Ciona intestinalis TaxID=7719 RepID=F7BPN8_CIOIN